jgi:hypothetical protein
MKPASRQAGKMASSSDNRHLPPDTSPSPITRHPSPIGDATAITVLVALVAVVAWNRLSFDSWLTRMDLMTFFLPWYTFLGERLRDFAVPGWNPHLFGGTPFAGDPESGWMYFPAMLLFTLVSSATAAFKGMVVFQLAVAAISTYVFARVLGMGALASLVAATVYLLGPFLHWNTHCCLIFSQFATWIPLALLGIERSLQLERWRDRFAPWFLSGLAVSQMFGGWIGEGWLYAVLLPAAYIGYRALLSPPRPGIPFLTRFTLGAATGIAVLGSGMALAAAGMLPRYAVNAEMNLAGGDYSQLGTAAVLNPPWSLDYLLMQTLGEGSGYHFRAAAFGGAAVVLSLLALPLARQRFAAPFFAVLTLVAMTLTLDTTPLHQLFYLIPRYQEFHDHDAWRTISLAAIGPAMLSGAAIEALPRWRGRPRFLPVVIAPFLFLIVVAIALVQFSMFLGWVPLVAAAVTTALIGIAVASASPHPSPLPARRERERFRLTSLHHGTTTDGSTPSPGSTGEGWGEGKSLTSPTPPSTVSSTTSDLITLIPILILAVIVLFPTGIELAGSWLGWPRQGMPWQDLERDPALDATLGIEESRGDPFGGGEFLQQQLALSRPFRYAGYSGFGYPVDTTRREPYMARRLDPYVQALLTNGRPIFLGLYDVQGYDPLQLSRYVEFMTALNGAPQDYHTEFLMPAGLRSPLLDLLDVRYLLVDASLPPDRDDVAALTAGLREVYRTPLVVVYERNPALPHAWIAHDAQQVTRSEAPLLLASQTIDPFQTALIEGAPPALGQLANPGDDTARVTAYEPDKLTIQANSTAPGLLVVSEIYASGWRAFIDGNETPVLPTDLALRGVALPAGPHTVELRYEPLSLRVGLLISGIAAVAMLAVFVAAGWSWLTRSRNAPLGRTIGP